MASTSTKQPHPVGVSPARAGIVDCDVHNALQSHDALKPYLPERWHGDYDRTVGRSPGTRVFIQGRSARTVRVDSSPPAGGPAGSDFELLKEQLLDEWSVDYAILAPLHNFYWPTYGKFGLAVAEALNRWNAGEWLDRDPRLYASIVVPIEDPELAAREIARCVADGRFVQVLLPVRTREPLGHPKYRPLFAAAAEHGLPVVVHVAGFGGIASAVGWPSYFFEWHVGWQYPFHGHVTSLIASGIFDELPTLQVVLQEAGLAWMPPLLWRLDRSSRLFGSDGPSLHHAPSTYIRRNFWFTTQPIDEPENPAYFPELLGHLGMSDRILFASDYPHWDFDSPSAFLPKTVSKELRDQILRTNARQLFSFPDPTTTL